jgi:pyridoxal phosphate enzyme (YggS family)
MGTIAENVQRLLSELPGHVTLVAAAKTRTPEEVTEAVEAGVKAVGENYVQEAQAVLSQLGRKAAYHFIGHLQTNKVKKAIDVFDIIETVDSLHLAQEINKQCSRIHKTMKILIEINSGREPQKHGVFPEDAEPLIRQISNLPCLKIMGLMTMGPYTDEANTLRPFFIETRKCYENIKSMQISNVSMEKLSMGMTGSYRTAVEEGANCVRIGTGIFGERKSL